MDGTPIWRTRLWPALMAWMGLAVAAPFGVWPLEEQAPLSVVAGTLILLFVVAPAVLLAWSLVHMMREPVSGWICPTLMLAFCGSLVPAARPLADAGLLLNLHAHTSVYERLIGEAKAGRLSGRPIGGGWVEGTRDTIRYRFNPARPGRMEFVWMDSRLYFSGVRYDETPCRPQPGLRCASRGRTIEGLYSYFEGLY